MKKLLITSLGLTIGLFAVTSCGGTEQTETTTEETTTEATETDIATSDSNDELRFRLDMIILNNLMVPVSIIEDLKKEEKALYHPDYINNLDNVSKYDTKFSQALNFGVYGMDILYNAAHDHTAEIAEYSVKTLRLAEALGVAEVYNDEDMAKFLEVADDHQALLDFIVEEYHKVDKFMVEHGQHNTLLLSLTGGVIESMYYTGKAIEEYGMSDLKYSLLCNERNILNQLIPLYDYFEDEKKDALKSELLKIQEDFNFKSRDELTDERAHKLDEDIITLRNKIVNNEL